jgi:UDP-glucose-4-epimerase GalE
MSILVTGGAGYIGSHTVRRLRQEGHDVAVLDSLELGHPEATPAVPLVVGDIADQGLVADTVARHQVDTIVHFAAYKAPGESMRDPGRYFANNVAGTASLLEAAHRAGVSAVVFSSSCAVYGTPERLPVAEDAPIRPESPYGESKALVERMLVWYDACHGMRSVSLRYFNAAGAAADASIGEDWSVTLNLVPLVMKALLGRRPPFQLFGTDYPTPDGTAIRDYVHVEDLAEAHVRAVDYLAAGGISTTLNLGTGMGSSVRQVLAAAEAASGRPVPVEEAPRRPGDPVALYANNTRARQVLGWAPRHGLDEMVATAWRWHSTHPDGFERAKPSAVGQGGSLR